MSYQKRYPWKHHHRFKCHNYPHQG